MKLPSDDAHAGSDFALIDRLVDGELDESSRARLLRRLDHEPDGWKRCATAFLEAQAWRAVMLQDAGEAPAVPGRVPAGRRAVAARQVLAVAAALAVAFSVGFVSRGPAGGSFESGPGRAIARRAEVQPDAAAGQPPAAPPSTRPSPAVPDYLRRQMERQGYRVEGDRRLVPLALEDGRKLAVPVDTVSMRYVGRRIH